MALRKLVVVRGGGDIATGTICRLFNCGYMVLVLETKRPSAIRRNVALSEAVYEGESQVENVKCVLAADVEGAFVVMERNQVAMIVAPNIDEVLPEITRLCHMKKVKYTALVDGILAKKNLGTRRGMAPITIGLGPGFEGGKDVDAAIETMRGHGLGRILYRGKPMPDTKTPGIIAGVGKERVIHAPAKGVLRNVSKITDTVKKGQVIAEIADESTGDITPVYASIDGLLRGLIRDGYYVTEGFKIADIDPRTGEYDNCFTISDKARCIAGGVLEAILHLENKGGKLWL